MYRSLVVAFLILFSGVALSQTSTNSPYSSRGIGDVGYYGDAYTSALGGAAVALTDSSQVNLQNPSTYSLLAKQLPLFSVGVNHYQKWFSSPDSPSSRGQFTGISHMALVVPFGKRFGMAGGLKPFSRTGYEINDHTKVQSDSIFYTYKGRGEIYEALLGFSVNVLDAHKHSLSIGVNGKIYFGRIENERKAFKIVKNNDQGGMDIKATRARGLGVDIGVNYNYRPTLEHSIRVAGTYRPGLNTNFDKSQTRIFFSNYSNQATYDTIINSGATKGTIYVPSKTNLGFSYVYTPLNEGKSGESKLMSLTVAFDYSMEDWANYEERFDNEISAGQYVNSSAYRLGVEITPHRFPMDRGTTLNYLHKISYRLGAYFVSTPYEINGLQLVDKGVTAGFGFPFVMNRAVSTVNLSVNYGTLGNKNATTGLKENYLGFNLGINIAPGYDRWFRKYKLD